MKDKYIFLDIDGVVNHEKWYYKQRAVKRNWKCGVADPKCIELLNVMSEADIALKLSVVDNKPQYIFLSRISPYDDIAQRYPIYGKLKELLTDSRNHVICSR